MKNNKILIWLRLVLLFILTAYVSYEAYMHQVLGAGKSPSAHALCPYGGLESLYQLFSQGSFISKIFTGTVLLFAITLIVAFLFRRSFCGILCPFGAIQEFMGWIGCKVLKRKYTVPVKIDRPLRYLKYVLLVVTVFYAWETAGLWMSPYDPWAAYAHIGEGFGSLWSEYAVGTVILIITLLGSFVYDRFFCKYLCPMGALYAIIGKISPHRVARNDDVCVKCGKCNKACPMNIDVQGAGEVKSAECINCQSCVLSCPKAGALEVRQGKKAVKPLIAFIIVLGLFFGSIFVLQIAGVYNLLPEKLKAGETIEFAEVKGYMTIEEAAGFTGTELSDFYDKFGIPANVPSNTKMKDISKAAPGYSFDEAKESFGGLENDTAGDTGNNEEKIDIGSVRGSMTITEAAATVGVDIKEIYRLFQIPDNILANTYMRDLEKKISGYDFEKIKESLK